MIQFVEALEVVQQRTHAINRRNGFWEDLDRIAALGHREKVIVALSRIGLIHTEPSEAVEALRKQPEEQWSSLEKDSVAREMAGTVVRIMDFCEWLNLPLGQAILEELKDNEKRGPMHGGKAA